MILKNIPNILSISRIFLAPIFFFFLVSDILLYVWFSLIVFFLGSLTDALDGYFARRYQVESKFGKNIDPLSDKVFILVSFLSLCIL